MLEASIVQIEEKLGHPLPAEYRAFLLESTPDDRRDFPVLLYPPDLVFKRNLGLRAHPDSCLVRVKDATGEWRLFDQAFPADWLVIGDNGGGDHWFIVRDEPGSGICFWSHESHEAAPDDRYRSFSEALRHERQRLEKEAARYGPKPSPERIIHPLLGELIWTPGDGHRSWSGTGTTAAGERVPFYIQVPAYVKAEGAELAAILESVAPVVARAVAATPTVFDAALPDLLREQHYFAEINSQLPKLTADQLRLLLTQPTLNAHCEPDALQLKYLYTGGEPFGWNMIEIKVDTDLNYQELQWF